MANKKDTPDEDFNTEVRKTTKTEGIEKVGDTTPGQHVQQIN